MSDFPVEESVCLLKRATWVQDQLKVTLQHGQLFRLTWVLCGFVFGCGLRQHDISW